MKIRRIATATFLATALLFGGASLAAADGARPARDVGSVPSCEQLEQRLAGLHQAQAAHAAHHARIEARLADAVADGNAARVARLQRQLANVEHAQEHLATVVARVQAVYDAHCGFVIPE